MATTPPSPNDLTRQQLDELDSLLQRMLSLPISSPTAAKPAATPPPAVPPLVPTPPAPRTSLAGYPLPPHWDEAAVPPAGWRADPPAAVPKPPHVAEEPAEYEEMAMPAVALAGPAPAARESAPPFESGPMAMPFAATNLAGHPPEEPRPISPFDPVPLPRTVRGVDAPLVPPTVYAPPVEEQPAEPAATSDPTPTPEAAPFTPDPEASVPTVMLPLYGTNRAMELVLGLLGPVGAKATRPAVKQVLGWAGVVMLTAATVWSACGLGLVPGF